MLKERSERCSHEEEEEPCHVAPQNDQGGQWHATEVSEKMVRQIEGGGGVSESIPPIFFSIAD